MARARRGRRVQETKEPTTTDRARRRTTDDDVDVTDGGAMTYRRAASYTIPICHSQMCRNVKINNGLETLKRLKHGCSNCI